MLKHAYGLRGLLAAIIVIVLSAGAAAAAGPGTHPDQGLATAAEKAGKTVPVAAQAAPNRDEVTVEDEEAAAPEVAAASEHCATDPSTLDEAALAELNHGAIVCWAAHQETPAEFDNHGAWVSSMAKDNHGSEVSAEAGGGKPEGAGKPEGVGKP